MEDTKPHLLTPINVAAPIALVCAAIWLGWWFYDRSQYLYVTDARIASTMISVSSRMPGWVVAFPVREGQLVVQGQVLVGIDTRDADLQLAELEASLNTLKAEYIRLQSQLVLKEKQIYSNIKVVASRHRVAQSELSETEVVLAQTRSDLKRAESLLHQKMVSEETWESRRTDRDKAIQVLNRSIAQVAAAAAEQFAAEINIAELDVLQKELQIVSSRQTELDVQRQRLLNTLDDYVIKSPVNGVIDETFVNQGEYVYPGQRILMLHDPENIWIKANIKETNIGVLHEGAHVEVSVDAYPDEVITATVRNVGNAATSTFALLPSPNPSGNFTKITQRLEVQMELGPHESLLKPGMMVELKIDIL